MTEFLLTCGKCGWTLWNAAAKPRCPDCGNTDITHVKGTKEELEQFLWCRVMRDEDPRIRLLGG